jgi:hypothetical protein
MDKVCVEVCAVVSESVTWTVKLAVPEVPGIPLMIPVDELREAQGGSAPLTTVQLYGVIPPVA